MENRHNSCFSPVKRLALTALFTALAYVSVFLINVPLTAVAFLKFDPKEVFIIIAACLLSPIEGLVISFLVPLLQMLTISKSGIIGFILNFVASVSLVLPVAMIYHKKPNLKGLIAGLCTGAILINITMAVWNYVFTPIFTPEFPREAIISFIYKFVVPFNLLKSGIDALLVIFVYLVLWPHLKKMSLIKTKGNLKTQLTFCQEFALELTLLCVLILISLILVALAAYKVI